MANKIKETLATGDVVVGTMINVSSSKLTEIISMSGFDFVVIDMEHGGIDITAAEDMVRAAELEQVTPIIRVTENRRHFIKRALDIGAQGLHVPEVNTPEDAARIVYDSKYSPDGLRGMAGVRALGYGLKESLSDAALRVNAENMVIIHIEDMRAVDALDELLEVPGIDVYFLGPTDLSNSMGIPGQSGHPDVVRTVEDAIKKIVAAGKTAGTLTPAVDRAKQYIDLGLRYVVTHAVKYMVDGSRAFCEELRK